MARPQEAGDHGQVSGTCRPKGSQDQGTSRCQLLWDIEGWIGEQHKFPYCVGPKNRACSPSQSSIRIKTVIIIFTKMNILIVSIDHFLQRTKGRFNSAELILQKSRFEALIRKEVARRNVEFIGEESDPRIVTIAKQIADSCDPPIPWRNIDMPKRVRREAQIFAALQARPATIRRTQFGYLEVEHRIPEDHVREIYFVEETLRNVGDSQSVLILCGDMHTEELASKFRNEGHIVETNDEMCPEKRWLPEIRN
jgi:hypothetical protein